MKSVYFIFIVFFISNVLGQRVPNNIILEGTILGYSYNPSVGIFNRSGTIEIEGTIEEAKLQVFQNGQLIQTIKTNSDGKYSVTVPIAEKSEIVFEKAKYGKSSFTINCKDLPGELKKQGVILNNIELLLNRYDSKKPMDEGVSFGEIYYHNFSKSFRLKPTEFSNRDKLFKKEAENSVLIMMSNGLEKNLNFNNLDKIEIVDSVSVPYKNENSIRNTKKTDTDSARINESHPIRKGDQSFILFKSDFETIKSEDIAELKDKINQAKEQLEVDRANAIYPEDFAKIQLQEELILAAELELAHALEFLEEKDQKIAAQSKLIYLFGLLGVFFLVLMLFIYQLFRKKKEYATVLLEKNRSISESIKYAQRIQMSVLPKGSSIQSILPKAFVYHQPLDQVSGDFYWFAQINELKIVAAIDCTGHGVPGAFMSLIGNTLLNQIVKENKLIDPGLILNALNTGIITALNQKNNSDAAQDGMDASIITINTVTNEIEFAGAMNPLYIVSDGVLKILNGALKSIGGRPHKRDQEEFKFPKQKLQLKKGDNLYLFSDGFMDQFGGIEDEKFNVQRFSELLLKVSTIKLSKRLEEVDHTFMEWKGVRKQTDDVLLIGIEL